MKKLHNIQQKIKVKKSHYNKFGDFYYRSVEDIMESVKPLLNGAVILLSDELHTTPSGDYVCAKATFIDGDQEEFTTAYACIDYSKKKMDKSQITGSASSYARKYALNGLLLLDDSSDPDTERPNIAPKKKYLPDSQFTKLKERYLLGEDLNELIKAVTSKGFDLTEQQNKELETL